MKNKSFFFLAPAILCWCLFCIQGCKDPLIQNKNLLTKGDVLNLASDSFHLKAFSQFEKPIASNNVTSGVIGNIYDHNFGSTNAGFYAQCQLTNSAVYFGSNPVLDSAVLTLGYNGQYGPFTKPVNLSVFEINQDMIDSLTYYTNSSFQVKTPPIAQIRGFLPVYNDSIDTSGTYIGPYLQVRLSQSFGNKLLLADTNILDDNDAFLSYFKGLYITTSASVNGNGMLYIDIPSSQSGITLYYHNDSITGLSYMLPFSGASVNHFDNVYSGTPVYNSVHSPNPNGEQKIYVEAGAGVQGKILLPSIDSIPKNIGVNKAEILFSQSAAAADTQYAAPPTLGLFRIDDAGNAQFLDDQSTTGYGGVLATEIVNGVSINRYRFNITRYFQNLVEGIYTNNGLYLQSQSINSSGERIVIANSSTDKKYQITLSVIYTKL